jgi:DNA repair exonuclease SbcCD ATPase subunit
MAELLEAWKKIKSAHKELGNTSRFRPDLGQIITKYENDKKKTDDIDKQKDKLKDIFTVLQNKIDILKTKRQTHVDELGKLDNKRDADVKKILADVADPKKDAIATTAFFVSALEDVSKTRKELNDRIYKIESEELAVSKKVLALYKSRRAAISALEKKAGGDVEKLEAQLRSVITAYGKTAIQMDDDDMADDIRGLLKLL